MFRGVSAPIYKIDVEEVRAFFDEEIELVSIPGKLVDAYNKQKEEVIYESQSAGNIADCHAELFKNVKSQPSVSGWVDFFKLSDLELEVIKNELQHLVCFVIVDDELYAFTAGQSAVVFENFIDLTFPIEVGRRIAKPEVKGARANQITGMNLASDLHFRDPRRITYTESLDTVWSSLSGYMRETLLGNEALNEVYGSKNKIKVDVSSSLRLGPKVPKPEKMVTLIRWLAQQGEKDPPSNDGWAALDAIKLLSPRKKVHLINELRQALCKQIFVDHTYDNLALSHIDASRYGSATHYRVTQRGKHELLWDDAQEPTLKEIVEAAQAEDPLKALSEINIASFNEEYGDSYQTNGTLLSHLNGELRHDGRTYFLLSGKWYEVSADYVTEIQKDFLDLIVTRDLSHETIGMREWSESEYEGDYNKTSVPDAINGDTILTDNVELFDTLVPADGEVRILHVKKGFNVKVRDLRSQLLSSAQIIENDLRNGGVKLKEHHQQLVEKGRTALTQEEFLLLFEGRRNYCLCYGRKTKITPETIKSVTSSVAKMEVVSLNNQFRQISVDDTKAVLSIIWIPLI